jgi:hypothetical protein
MNAQGFRTHLTAFAVGALALIAAPLLGAAEYSLPACLAAAPVAIVVRIGKEAPRRAWLRGAALPALQVVDADSDRILWSAAALQPASQVFEALRGQFAGSLLPLDLDGDGIHDRIYAGDLAGRLWRFDLHHGLPAQQWATGGLFADFASATRGFVAAPDASLPSHSPSLSAGWLDIALGTARVGAAPADNRFYVLRDHHAFESWDQGKYDRWRPLREADLVQLPHLGATLQEPAPNGYFIKVGGSDFLSPALTVSGRATLALAEAGAATAGHCAIAAVVSSIDLATGNLLQITSSGTQSTRLAVSMTAGESFALHREGPVAACTLGETRIPACDVDLSARFSWWRREDAD